MIVAVRENHIEMAQFLLKETADVNSVDQDQRLSDDTFVIHFGLC